MKFNQFKNLSRIKDLPLHEQSRQWFIYQSNRIYESSLSPSAASSAAGAGGAGGSGGLLLTGFSINLYESYFKLKGIKKRTGELVDNSGVTFSGFTVLEKNPEDGYNYFVTNNFPESQMIFGKLKNDEVTIIDTENLTGFTNNGPGSLYYEGNGNFIYLDGCPPLALGFSGYTHSSVYRIDTEGNCEVVIQDVDISTYAPSCLFPYKNEVWGGLVFSGVVAGVGKFDLETGLFSDIFSLEVNNIPGVTNYKVWYILGSQVLVGRIYLSLYISNKDTSTYFQCIAELDIESNTSNFVSMIEPTVESDFIFDITTL